MPVPARLRALFVAAVVLPGLAVAGAAPSSAAAPSDVVPFAATGVTDTWTGGGTTDDWSDALNWSTGHAPANGDSVVVAPPTVTRCYSHVLNVPAGVQLQDFTMRDASPDGCFGLASVDGGSISVAGSFAMNAGRLGSATTVLPSATGLIQPQVGIQAAAEITADLTVQGSLRLAGNLGDEAVAIEAGTSLTVAPGGTLLADGSDDVVGLSCCTDPPHLTNNGTLRVGGGVLDVGAVEVDQNGLLDTPDHGSLHTADADVSTAGAGAAYTGTGTWQVYSASTVRMTGTQTLGADFHLVLGGNGTNGDNNLTGSFALAGTGTLDWNGGTIAAAMTVGAGVRVLLAGPSAAGDDRHLDGLDGSGPTPATPVAVTNHGTVSVGAGAGWYAQEGGRVDNVSDGTVALGAGSSLSGACCNDPGVLANHGGRVTVAAGASPATLDEVGYEATGGTTSIPTGQQLVLHGGATNRLTATTIAGGGTVQLEAPTTVSGTVAVAAATTLDLAAYPGTLDGTATIAGAGRFVWTGGTVTGALTVATAGGSAVSGVATKHLSDTVSGRPSTLRLASPTRLAAGEVSLEGSSRLTLAGATTAGPDVVLDHGQVVNTGAFTVGAAAGHPVQVTSAGFGNAGTVSVRTGRLQVDDNYTQTAGATTVAAGASLAVIGSSSTIVFAAGVFGGAGTLTGPVVSVAAQLRPGTTAPGVLHVAGSYTQGVRASAWFRETARAGDALAVSGRATVRGRATVVDSFVPGAASVRTVVTAGAPSVAFSCLATTGQGTTGSKARHWVLATRGHAAQLHSAAGRRSTC